MLLGVATLSMSAQNQNESESLSKDQSKALRDSLAQAIGGLAHHPDSIDLRLKRLPGISSSSSGNMPRMISIRSTVSQQYQYRRSLLSCLCQLNRCERYNFARLDYQNLQFWCLAISRHSSVLLFSIRKTSIILRLTTVSIC